MTFVESRDASRAQEIDRIKQRGLAETIGAIKDYYISLEIELLVTIGTEVFDVKILYADASLLDHRRPDERFHIFIRERRHFFCCEALSDDSFRTLPSRHNVVL